MSISLALCHCVLHDAPLFFAREALSCHADESRAGVATFFFIVSRHCQLEPSQPHHLHRHSLSMLLHLSNSVIVARTAGDHRFPCLFPLCRAHVSATQALNHTTSLPHTCLVACVATLKTLEPSTCGPVRQPHCFQNQVHHGPLASLWTWSIGQWSTCHTLYLLNFHNVIWELPISDSYYLSSINF